MAARRPGTRVRIGGVRYLNARPLLLGLEQGRGQERIELCHDTPAALAERLSASELEIALLPVIELARIPDLEIVPGLAIATHGPARSVHLVSRRPVDDVRSVALDPESRTSNALVQVLFDRLWRASPEFGPGPVDLDAALSTHDAVVRIGDKALFEPVPDGLELHDLGEAWTAATRLPFVFAVWAARAGVVDRELYELLHRSRRDGAAELDRIAEDYAWNGERHPAISREYLRRNILYRLGSREMSGLETFLRAARELGLVDEAASAKPVLWGTTTCAEVAALRREAR